MRVGCLGFTGINQPGTTYGYVETQDSMATPRSTTITSEASCPPGQLDRTVARLRLYRQRPFGPTDRYRHRGDVVLCL